MLRKFAILILGIFGENCQERGDGNICMEMFLDRNCTEEFEGTVDIGSGIRRDIFCQKNSTKIEMLVQILVQIFYVIMSCIRITVRIDTNIFFPNLRQTRSEKCLTGQKSNVAELALINLCWTFFF